MKTNTLVGFSRGWIIAGYVFVAGAALLVGRIVYEETLLTWRNGPQMVGFAMAHGALPFVVDAGLIGLLGGSLWAIASLVLLFRKRSRIPLTDWIPLVCLCLLATLLFVPYETWEEVTVRIAGPGSHGSVFMLQAAAHGRRRMVLYFLRKGYDVNYEDSGGTTPLSAAAVGGDQGMMNLLVSRGADANRQNRWGENALMAASETGQLEAVKNLLQKGVDACATMKDGRTAEALAIRYRHDDVARYLSSQRHCQEQVIGSCADPSVSACVHP
jgi:hypothetical protein